MEEVRGGRLLWGIRDGDGSEARHGIDCKSSVLLALVTEGEGLVLTGPLLAVIGDWGERQKNDDDDANDNEAVCEPQQHHRQLVEGKA